MEDSILEQSKGATYMSFILDVEIVIKKEGNVSIAERKVKNRNTRENNDSQDTERTKTPDRNKNLNVFVLSADPTNLRDISQQPRKKDLLLTEEGPVVSKNTIPMTIQNSEIFNDNNKVSGDNGKYEKQKYKSFHSHETNNSEILGEKHSKKKRTHKAAHMSKTFKSKVEPVDFSECNRIFMCNYLQLPRQNSDSALYYNCVKEKLLSAKIQDTNSVSEILSLLNLIKSLGKNNTNCLFSSATDLACACNLSSGDCSITNLDGCEYINKILLTKNMFIDLKNHMDAEFLNNYVKNRLLRNQIFVKGKNHVFMNTERLHLHHNLPSKILPNFHKLDILNSKDEGESLPNIKIEDKIDNKSSEYSNCSQDSENCILKTCLTLTKNYNESVGVSHEDLEVKCYNSDADKNADSPKLQKNITKEVAHFEEDKNRYCKSRAISFLQKIKSSRNFILSNPLNFGEMRKKFARRCGTSKQSIQKQTLYF